MFDFQKLDVYQGFESFNKTVNELAGIQFFNMGKTIKHSFGKLGISIYFCDILNIYTMKTLSLKLDDDIFNETEELLVKIKKSRNRYINEAVDYYNRINRRSIISKKLSGESKLVRRESLAVLSEFETLQDEN